MSTQKPSSRRFLAPNSSSTPKPQPKPSTGFRNGFTSQTPKATISTRHTQVTASRKVTPAKRFAITPAGHVRDAEEQINSNENVDVAGFGTQTPRPKLPWKLKKVESIEEGSYESSSVRGPGNSRLSFDEMESIEHSSPLRANAHMQREEEYDEADEEDEEMLFQPEAHPKRRRISPEPSSSASIPDPRTPIQIQRPSSHQFRIPAPKTPAPFPPSSIAPTATPGPAPNSHHRPHFILPIQPTSPPKPSRPLPEIFSPSRKNQKYVPGGLASTVHNWIIEMASTGFAAQDSSTIWGRQKEDGVKLRVRVTRISGGATERIEGADGLGEVECFPGSVNFVKGTTDAGLYNASRASSAVSSSISEVRFLLAGVGGPRGSGGLRIREGAAVGVRAPIWDVEILGEKWLVGVDWVVL